MSSRFKAITARNAVAFTALFVVLGGTATAASKLIDGKNIKKGTVTTKQVKDGSLTAADFAKGQLPAGAAGAKGDAGAQGAAGATGPAGAQGTTGAAGAAGAKGDDGAPGQTGPPGQTGATGSTNTLKNEAGDTVGSLISALPGVASSYTPGAGGSPGTFVPYQPATFIYAASNGTLITVGSDGVFRFPTEGRVLYEHYSAGVCSGRIFLEQPVSMAGQLFALSGAAQAYTWSGGRQTVPTEGVDGGAGCEQLGSANQTGFEVTKVATPVSLNSAVHVAVG